MAEEREEEVTEVRIFRQVYPVRSTGEPEYVRQLAEYLDRRMHRVSEDTQMADSLKVAILAALTIVDELFDAEKKYQELEDRVSGKSERLMAIVAPLLEASPRR